MKRIIIISLFVCSVYSYTNTYWCIRGTNVNGCIYPGIEKTACGRPGSNTGRCNFFGKNCNECDIDNNSANFDTIHTNIDTWCKNNGGALVGFGGDLKDC
jgi:hypothetical protein